MKTISFELAKRLEKLGVKRKDGEEAIQNNNLTWIKYVGSKKPILSHNATFFSLGKNKPFNSLCDDIKAFYSQSIEEAYSAYTLDEIMEMLPSEIEKKIPYYLYLEKTCLFPHVYYRSGYSEGMDTLDLDKNGHKHRTIIKFKHDNPAEAAGELLAWCIENGHVKPEEL